MPNYLGLTKEAVARRAMALKRYARWREQQPHVQLNPAEAILRVTELFELLPSDSRSREINVTGIQELRRRLRVLGGGGE